jgi:hypothetical protein
MAGVKPRHAAALALVVWYLMTQPAAKMIPYRHCPRCFHGWAARTFVNQPSKPPPGWLIVKTFPTRGECEAQLRANPRDRCIASDDPRLKEK